MTVRSDCVLYVMNPPIIHFYRPHPKDGVSVCSHPGGEGIPTLDGEGGGGTHLGWREGYLPRMGGRRYLPWTGGEGYLPRMGGGGTYLGLGGGGTYPGQVMPRAVCLLRLQAGGLFVISNVQP